MLRVTRLGELALLRWGFFVGIVTLIYGSKSTVYYLIHRRIIVKRKYGDRKDPLLFGYESPVLFKMQQMLHSAESRAKSCGRDFNLVLDDLIERYIEICPILEIELLWNNSERVRHGSPSLDRIDNTQGYVKHNVQIISHRANTLKKDYLMCEWEKMCEYMRHAPDKPYEITESLFLQPLCLSESEQRKIRSEHRKGASMVHIAAEYDLPLDKVIRYIRSLG